MNTNAQSMHNPCSPAILAACALLAQALDKHAGGYRIDTPVDGLFLAAQRWDRNLSLQVTGATVPTNANLAAIADAFAVGGVSWAIVHSAGAYVASAEAYRR